MLSCPNRNTKEWKALVEKLGESRAYDEYINNGYDIPDASNYETVSNKLLSDMRLWIEKKISDLGRKQVKGGAIKKGNLDRLKNAYEVAALAEKVNIFIDTAHSELVGTKNKDGKYTGYGQKMDTLISKLKKVDRKDLNSEDVQKDIATLTTYFNYATGYNILDDILSELTDAELTDIINNEHEKDSPLFKLKEAIQAREHIKKKYLTSVKPLLVDAFTPYINDAANRAVYDDLTTRIKRIDNQIEAFKKAGKYIEYKNGNEVLTKEAKKAMANRDKLENELKTKFVDRASLLKALDEVGSDISVLDFWLTPASSSGDTVLGLFAKAVKDKFEDMRMSLINFQREASEAFTKFEKATSRFRGNDEQFNKGIYEEIEVPIKKEVVNPETGEIVTSYDFVKRMAFVQKFNVTSFEKSKIKMYGEASEIDNLDARRKFIAKWYRDNTEKKSDNEINKIISELEEQVKEGIITEDELYLYISDNMSNKTINIDAKLYNHTREDIGKNLLDLYKSGSDNIYFKGDFTQPSSAKYLNKNWLDLQNNVALKEYYEFLTDKYFKAQDRLPKDKRRGYLLPSIRKTGVAKVQSSGNKLRQTWGLVKNKFTPTENDTDTKNVITDYAGNEVKVNPIWYTSDIAHDEVSLDLMSSVMMFEKMSKKFETVGELEPTAIALKATIADRKTTKTEGDKRLVDQFAKKLGIEKYILKSNKSNVEAALEAFIDMQLYGETQFEESVLGVRVDKAINTMMGAISFSTIGGDALKSVANSLQANIQIAIESTAKQFFKPASLAKAKSRFVALSPELLKDFGKINPTSKLGNLMMHFDAMQGEFVDRFGHGVTASTAGRLISTDAWFMGMKIGEYEVQATTMLAMLEETKVTKTTEDANGKKTTITISLYDALEQDSSGKIVVKEGVNFSDSDRKDVVNKLHAINKRMHGIYNSFDQSPLQRHSVGRLILMFRKFVAPGYKKRFKTYSVDQELGLPTEGTYRTFFRTLAQQHMELLKFLAHKENDLTDTEKANIRRTLTEMGAIFTVSMLAIILGGDADDPNRYKKMSYAQKWTVYQLYRQRSELFFFLNPQDALKIIKNPSAAQTKIEQTIRFVDLALFTWDPDKLTYKRKTGPWSKGDSKTKAAALRLLGFNGNNIYVEEAIKNLNLQ